MPGWARHSTFKQGVRVGTTVRAGVDPADTWGRAFQAEGTDGVRAWKR